MHTSMKRFIFSILLPVFLPALCTVSSCSSEDDPYEQSISGSTSGSQQTDNNAADDETTNDNNPVMENRIEIRIGQASFTCLLENNDVARAFADMLPLRMNMSELNGNEKYSSLGRDLPTSAVRPGTINAGDLMLWGSSTLVLFYETFSSSYSYTRLGRITDTEGLAEAVGNGNVTVYFDKPIDTGMEEIVYEKNN